MVPNFSVVLYHFVSRTKFVVQAVDGYIDEFDITVSMLHFRVRNHVERVCCTLRLIRVCSHRVVSITLQTQVICLSVLSCTLVCAQVCIYILHACNGVPPDVYMMSTESRPKKEYYRRAIKFSKSYLRTSLGCRSVRIEIQFSRM